MLAYLKARSGPDTGRRYRLDVDRTMHVGRDSNCEIMLSDPVTSRYHAVLFFEEERWQVRDTKSRNGMLVNGQKTDHATLSDSHVIQVGKTELQFFESGEEEDTQREQTIVLGSSCGGKSQQQQFRSS